MKNKIATLILTLLAWSAVSATAQVIDFDTSTYSGNGLKEVGGPEGQYAGFVWTNFHSLEPIGGFAGTGYDVASDGGSRVGYSYYQDGSSGFTKLGGGTFDVNSATIAAAWNNQTVTFEGLLNNVVVDSITVGLTTTTAINQSFNFLGIDRFRVIGGSNQVAFENLTVNGVGVPAPMTWALLMAGFAMLGRKRS